MIIAILSRHPNGYSTRRLYSESLRRGHDAAILDTLRCSIHLQEKSPELFYFSTKLPHFDAIIPRIAPTITFYGLAVLRQFEMMGVYTPNESIAIARSRDKLRAAQILSRHDIGIPPTAFVRSKGEVLPAIQRLGGAPVMIKILEGTQGIGVILAENERVAEAIIETLQFAKQNVLIQKFIKESKGRDIRAIVVGDRVVAAMRRQAVGDEYRSNVHRGSQTQKITLDATYEHTAIRAAQIIGLRVAGVDMLESDEGPQVMEVNSSPGLEGIEQTTGINVAEAIIQEIEHQVLFPDVDLRQRLRLAAGYGIAEFAVHNMPSLEGKCLRDARLFEHSIRVIHITRNTFIIPNPGGDEVIQTGDMLLCYGELNELRALMPNRKKPF
ncbi:MAG: RimK family alpha-L-glutamate ligase [bacterium]|jgi:ribosomal protein S6--L-glutamate ligase|nr:RimK family alpha-L-glutamate ligase [bacterium]